MKPIFLVSACLAGEPCRYDGKANTVPELAELARSGQAIPICPEQLGGLPCPRTPCERKGERVMGQDGKDYTAAFQKGADRVGEIAVQNRISAAILKSRSPSCGKGYIYDGTFSRRLIPGNGLTAEKLLEVGIDVYTEEDEPALWNWKRQ